MIGWRVRMAWRRFSHEIRMSWWLARRPSIAYYRSRGRTYPQAVRLVSEWERDHPVPRL